MNNEFAEELGMNRSLNIMRSYLHRLAEIVEDEGEYLNVRIYWFTTILMISFLFATFSVSLKIS